MEWNPHAPFCFFMVHFTDEESLMKQKKTHTSKLKVQGKSAQIKSLEVLGILCNLITSLRNWITIYLTAVVMYTEMMNITHLAG